MKELKVKPIPTRIWKDKKVDLVIERDKDRKKSQESVDKRIYYMWFNYLKLCLNLEEINYSVKKKGAKGKVLGETGVKVNRKIYKDWDLKDLYTMNFKKWYKDPKHRKLFQQGGFIPTRGTQYHSLVKRYNIFIEYFNRRTGNYDKDMQLCEDIIKKFQKERFDILKRNDPRSDNLSPFNKLIHKDIKDCEKTILACCNGEFPKSV